jgi:hypothetical protein
MHLTHEVVEMTALGNPSGPAPGVRGLQSLVEPIHQDRLAAAHSAPKIQTTEGGTATQAQPLSEGGQLTAQAIAQFIEECCRFLLGRVEIKSTGGDLRPQAHDNRLWFAGH